ncbi:hypothetical protein KFU94_01220 [Chloroflexi bacterium TSY]|nr:hypothetical protein [Chloroflexi bacterium TSY]
MFQVVYEYTEPWPQAGPLRVKGQFSEEIAVKPEEARRTANSYLGLEVGMALRSNNPMLVLGGEHPIWRLAVDLYWYGFDKVATLGTIDVDARTDKVVPLSNEEIMHLREKANDIVSRLTPTAEPAV